MIARIIGAALACLISGAAHAVCLTLPNTLLNGVTADAALVMGNFNAIATCINAPNTLFGNQTANLVYAGPSSGAAAAPSFRALVAADFETISTWTPTDASGATLTFTNVTAGYTKIGNLVFAYGSLTYPVTANGSGATIGGLPFTSANNNYAQQCNLSYVSGGTAVKMTTNVNATTAPIFTAAGAVVTNATMSGLNMTFMCIYPVA